MSKCNENTITDKEMNPTQEISGNILSTCLRNSSNIFSYEPSPSLRVQINSRYISKITNSPRKTYVSNGIHRMRPYFIPIRSRTKSENADSSSYRDIEPLIRKTTNNTNELMNLGLNHHYTMMDTSDGNSNMEICNNTGGQSDVRRNVLLKKSRSLEDVRIENLAGSQPSHEMEFVSSRIQKLKVRE